MISDGAPAHTCDDPIDYVPPISIKDTSDAAKKIIKRGTAIIAIALNDAGNYNCYDQLKQIYPDVISCSDVKKLTGQLFRIISKLFEGEVY
jgi:nitric oxide reductase activation protein